MKKRWVEKVKGMKKGEVRTIHVSHPREAVSARAAIGQYVLRTPELGYKCSISFDRAKMELSVEAIAN